MKKVLKNNFKTIIVAIIASVVTSVTTIFAYSLIAENVGFTPHDTTWNVENVDAALNNLNLRYNQLSTHYSYDEQVVGEWVDGKPLYQKTIDCGAMPRNGTDTSTPINVSNLDKIIRIEGININSTDSYNIPFVTTGDTKNFVEMYVDTGGFILAKTKANWNGNLYVTILYTKTTD